jgi:hypothetical protein
VLAIDKDVTAGVYVYAVEEFGKLLLLKKVTALDGMRRVIYKDEFVNHDKKFTKPKIGIMYATRIDRVYYILNKSGFISITTTKQIARILKDLAIVIGHLLKDLFIAAVKIAVIHGIPAAIKAGKILKRAAVVLGRLLIGLVLFTAITIRSKGKPAAMHTVYWLREKSIVIVRKVKPKAIEAGQISKGLLVTATRKIKTVERGGRLGQEEKPKVIQVEQSVEKISSTILSRIIEKVKEQASRFISDEKDYETFLKQKQQRQQITTAHRVAKVSDEIILEKEKTMNLNEILAEEISQNGIECKPIADIGSLPIEKKTYYSHLFPISPRIVTNRGCIRLEGNDNSSSTRRRTNIDLIQIIQMN